MSVAGKAVVKQRYSALEFLAGSGTLAWNSGRLHILVSCPAAQRFAFGRIRRAGATG